jgi:hypothetical protein
MTTEANTTEETTETPEVTIKTPTKTLNAEQEISALRAAHEFFSNFDRVPGFAANQWSQALDTIAVVANSLIAKHTETTPSDDDLSVSSDTTEQ